MTREERLASNSGKSANSFMPLYGGDYLRDTMHLSCAEHGIYLRLLIHYWHAQAPLPAEQRKLEGIAGVRDEGDKLALTSVIQQFFKRHRGGSNLLHNKRMDREIRKAIELKEKFRKAGLKSAEARSKAGSSQPQPATATATAIPQPQPEPPPKPQKEQSQKRSAAASPRGANGSETWDSYASAFKARYSVDPVRNAKVNAQIEQLVKRVGQQEAPIVAAFYLSHNAPAYVQRGHSVGMLLIDAEKLRTEWARGRKITSAEARNAEQGDAMSGQVERVRKILGDEDADR